MTRRLNGFRKHLPDFLSDSVLKPVCQLRSTTATALRRIFTCFLFKRTTFYAASHLFLEYDAATSCGKYRLCSTGCNACLFYNSAQKYSQRQQKINMSFSHKQIQFVLNKLGCSHLCLSFYHGKSRAHGKRNRNLPRVKICMSAA